MYLLNQANQAVRSQLEQALRTQSLTGIQYTVLSIVGSRTGISSAELSRRFFVTPQTMNEIVTGLEKRGLLKREASADNKRILTASLTGSGEETLKECDRIADEIEKSAFSDMSDNDFNDLRRILRGRLVALRGG
ncbi:MarR family winged helix-turn-helix transcriptional regulator [Amorphus orientalis]|uniref:DNA-binding MarR family transcriptional regulator n=1 Tax=Amorphus orientalis TaxID=649198 RepID=A0AAE4AQY4_9HYPH|nr:MarR family transcriptional regulator [Amorphus orientalis]MDQ0314591.1 DNA-binding MarR family transcriptional regulator [Amorphus orientalis]